MRLAGSLAKAMRVFSEYPKPLAVQVSEKALRRWIFLFWLTLALIR